MSAQRVVAFLALHAGPLARMFVAGNLWMDSSEERALAALRTALWRMRTPGRTVVRCDGHALSLEPSIDIDLITASRRARELLEGGAMMAPPTRADVRLLRDAGDVLPDWYDDWVLIERERFRQLRLHALEALAARLAARAVTPRQQRRGWPRSPVSRCARARTGR